MKAKEVATLLGVSARTVYDLPIPRFQIGRRVVWERADVDAYKASCRSTTTKPDAAGPSSFAVLSPDASSGLANFFRKAGIEPRPKRTTASSRQGYSGLRLVSVPLSGRKAMTDKRVLLVSEDGAAEVGGKEYVLVPRVEKPAPRIVFRVMYDCHMFDKLEATTPDAAVEEWLAKYSENQQAYINGHSEPQNIGRPDLCPMSIIYGPKDERRYGPMVHWRRDIYDKAQLERWRVECNKAIADMNAMLSAAALDLSGLPRVPERKMLSPTMPLMQGYFGDGFNAALDAMGVKAK